MMKITMWCMITYCLAISGLIAQVDYVVSPIDLTGKTSTEKMNTIYASCEDTYIHIDSTVNFILDGCTAPVLVSMDAMRSSSDPFDPNKVGKDEIAVGGPPYHMDFVDEGMYVIFCDPSFKTVAGCITMTSDSELITGTPSEPVPTLDEWGLFMLILILIIVGIVTIKEVDCKACTYNVVIASTIYCTSTKNRKV